jgi:hypothetical protein
MSDDLLAGFTTRIEIKACYDYRDDPKDQRGAHGSELHLILACPGGAVIGRIGTGWVTRPLAGPLGAIRPPARRDRPGVDATLHDCYPSGSGIFAHSSTPRDGWEEGDQACCYLGTDKCWVTGGYMISDTLLTKLVEGGDRAAFEFMAELYRDWFAEQPAVTP